MPPKNELYLFVYMNTPDSILSKLQSGEITLDECKSLLAKKQATFKVTEKGCIGIYGIRKFPISLYKNELDQILNALIGEDWEYSALFQDFLTKNASSLKDK
jgi:hypothetical protein